MSAVLLLCSILMVVSHWATSRGRRLFTPIGILFFRILGWTCTLTAATVLVVLLRAHA